MPKIALILGSARTLGNAKGIASWLVPIVENHFRGSQSDAISDVEIVTIDPTTFPHSLGPIIDGAHIPAEIRDPALYSSLSVREWSSFISSCDAFIFLSPQYNWGVPGGLKNMLDHLYWEWRNKPALIVTYGGHGGSRCAAHLQDILGGGLKMQIVARPIEITLPNEFIRGNQRVSVDGPEPEFLQAYERAVDAAANELKELLSHPPHS